MRDLLNQNRALSPSTIRTAISIVGILFAVSLLIIVITKGFGWYERSGFLSGLLWIALSSGFLLTLYMIVRLQAEAILAAHRSNDRLAILTDAINAQVDVQSEARGTAASAKKSSSKPKPRKSKFSDSATKNG